MAEEKNNDFIEENMDDLEDDGMEIEGPKRKKKI
jgi:hypothetical protein